MRLHAASLWFVVGTLLIVDTPATAADPVSGGNAVDAQRMRELLRAPLLFVRRHSYSGIHIYDTYYKWPPGGGGIYVIENPGAPPSQWKERPVIDPSTEPTLGLGVYSDPELSWDATKLLFCFKGEPNGSTSIYEIGIDGRGLRRVTDPSSTVASYKGSLSGQHDVAPAYLPDGRIVFLSTRPSGLVPCNNTGVAILHVMNADGSDIHPISVNNVNEFDPCPLPDGRLLFGRWEYVDKNALTIQSLWTANPDGTQETALFANNMVFPEAILDARPVPNSHLIVGTFAKHNSTPRGAIALIDPYRGKNNPNAIINLEHPDQPTFDQGESCEPWPVSPDIILFSGRPAGSQRNVIEAIDRHGNRTVLHSDPEICLHSPMLVQPRLRPAVICDSVDRRSNTGRFVVQDIYQGLPGVERGEVKWLRVIEETSRTSERTDGPNPYNQTFLVSCALAFSVKNYLGVVPVEEDGSAYFEVPAGRAVYLQALDDEGRLVQSMRTFVQAAPGTTRSCVGCHEPKSTSPASTHGSPRALQRAPSRLKPESWGSGYVDYPRMVQPVLDKHCVRCHGGNEGIAGGMDLSGGWTEHFSISYENLTSRRETQLMAYWIAGIDCMNGTALWSAQLFPPRSHGSGAAPLAELLVDGHEGRIPDLRRAERDLLLAWIDTNGLYYGNWNRTASGCAIPGWPSMREALVAQMQKAGCLRCHGQSDRIAYFENDWVNLEFPKRSRILRAPLPAAGDGLGLAWCRQRRVDPGRQRIHLLRKGYAHAVQPPEAFPRHPILPFDRSGPPVASFASTKDPVYLAMLEIIRQARAEALAAPRVDMPGAELEAGSCRLFVPPAIVDKPRDVTIRVDEDGVVHLTWEASARTIGLSAEVHRGNQPNFVPHEITLVARTPLFGYADREPPVGKQVYAIVFISKDGRSRPAYATVDVPVPAPPDPPRGLRVVPASGAIHLRWNPPARPPLGYHVFRAKAGEPRLQKITSEPVRQTWYADSAAEPDQPYRYAVCSISPRHSESEPTAPVEAVARFIKEPVFVATFENASEGRFHDGQRSPGIRHGHAQLNDAALDLNAGGHVTFPHDVRFELGQPISIECWVWLDQPDGMPVLVSCGQWNQAGWFLQRLGGTWRWHVGGIDCDGGQPKEGCWIHLVASYDGRAATLYENGQLVGDKTGKLNTDVWPGDLFVGQYSGGVGSGYQVRGRIKGVKIYHRPLGAAEIAQACQSVAGCQP